MGQLRRFLGIFVSLFIIAIVGNAHAAGYTCDDIKEYTSCVAGRYLNKSGAGNNCNSLCTAANAPANQTSIANGTRSCTGKYTGGPADNKTVGASACTGCSAYTCTCTNSNYEVANQGSSTCACNPKVYTITLNNNNGTGGDGTVYEKYATGYSKTNFGTTVTSVTVPTRSGYTFRGYYTAQLADLTADGSTGTQRIKKAGTLPSNTTFTANTTIYAAWARNCATVANGTCTLTVSDAGVVDYTTSCNTGYTLTAGANTYNPTCTANCNTITLNATTNGGSGGTTTVYKLSGSTTWYSDSKCTTTIQTITKPSKTNATYGGHYTTSSNGTQCISSTGTLSTSSSCNVTGNTTLYAQYDCNANYRQAGTRIAGTCTPSIYTITLNNNNGTGGSGTVYEKYATGYSLTNFGTTVTSVTVPTRSGYTFRGYYTAQLADLSATGTTGTQRVKKAGTLPSNTTFTANTTIYAAWARNCATVANGSCTLSVTDTGAVTYTTSCNTGYELTAGSGTYNPTCTAKCNTITLNATTNGGSGGTATVYKLTGSTAWYSNSGCTTAITTLPTKPSKTNATYGGHYTTSTSGTQCINSTGTLSTSASCNVTGPTTLYAQYDCNANYRQAGTRIAGTCTPNVYTISYTLNSGTQASSGVPTSYTYGTGATINGTPTRSGYTFEGWCTDNALTSCAKTQTISTTATGNKTFYAKWSINATISNKSKVYNGTALSCAGVSGTPSGATVKYCISTTSSACTPSDTTVPSVTNVADSGTVYYQITATNAVTKSGNFKCEITRAAGNITSISDQTLTYSTAKNVTVTRSGNGTVSASSSDTSVATVSVSGTTLTLTPVKAGTATITVNAAQGSNHNAATPITFKVTVNRGNCTVTLSRASSSVTAYPTSPATFSATTTGNGKLSVSTSNDNVVTATISSNGTVTPTTKGAGSATITVTSSQTDQFYACSATHTVTVPPANGELALQKDTVDIKYEPGNASATNKVITNISGGNITASSSNTEYVTVEPGADNVTITATSTGKEASNVTVTVKSAAKGNYKEATATFKVNVTCADGFYSKNGICTQCPEHAINCVPNPPDPDVPFNCEPGYKINATKDACEPAEFTVTYDCGTGSGTAQTDSTKPKYNASAGYTPKDNFCTKDGYDFAGWLVSGTSDIRDAGTKFIWKYTENKTFTAQWDAIGNYSATYSCGDGTGTAPAKDSNITFNGSYTVKANGTNNCTRVGYDFAGWSDGSKIVSGTITWTYTSSKTFTATWTPNVYPITLNNTTNGGTGNSTIYEKYSVGYSLTNFGTTVTSVTKPTKAGVTVTYNANGTTAHPASVTPTSASTSNTFNGYYTAASGGTQRITAAGVLPSNTTFTAATTLYAQWTCNGVTLPTPTRTGYTFNGWYTAASGGTRVGGAGSTYCPASATTIYAQWTVKTYTISYNLDGGTQASSGVPTSYTYGVGATISGQPTKGTNVFAGWCTDSTKTNCAKTQTISTTATEAKTFWAKWSSCPANATCSNNKITCDANYDWNEATQQCVLGMVECVAGKYYPGTGTTMVDCKASDGWYCPGTGKVAIGGGAGCYTACPASKNNGKLTTSKDKATELADCVESLSGVEIPKDKTDKNGTANTVCGYTGIVDGAASYEKGCEFTVTSCIDGYYVPIKDINGYKKQGFCEAVGQGYYRAAGTCNANPTSTNDTCMRSACPTPGTTNITTATQISQCHISCTQATIKDGTISAGTKTPVSTTLNYNGTAYPTCTYTLSCVPGYKKQGENTASATCVPNTFEVTLNIGYTGGTNQNKIYAKYNRGWYSDANASTTALKKITPPTRANYTFAGYYNDLSDTQPVINADGTFKDEVPKLTANTTLTAVWHGIPVECKPGQYYDGTTMKTCRSGEYCPGADDANLAQAYQGAPGCFIKCPTSKQNGTLSSVAGATSINDCKETLKNVSIPKANAENPNPVQNGTADTVCGYTKGANGSATYETGCVTTVKSCFAGYYVPIKDQTGSNYTKQGYCNPVEKGYYRVAGTCNDSPTAQNDTCMQVPCPDGGTTDGTGATSASMCYQNCVSQNIILGGKQVGVKEPVNTKAMLKNLATNEYNVCYYNAKCISGYVAVPEQSTTGTENPTCEVGTGWTITYVGAGEQYELPANAITQFTVVTENRTLPTPTKIGYQFEGWYENSSFSGTALTAIPQDRLTDMTLYAKWTAKLYPITVNPNNGTATYTVYMRYATGWFEDSGATKPITTLVKPDGNGNTFGGYYYGTTEAVNASGKILLNNLTPADNMEIIAKWQSQPITCPAGTYYPGTGSETNCKPCESGYYCEGKTVCESNDGNICGRSTCPEFVSGASTNVSSPARAETITACRKSGVTYASDANHVIQGTATCSATTGGTYEYNAASCSEYTITKCVAGYYRTTTTAEDKCEAVGRGYYSEGNNTERTQCPAGTTNVYTSDGEVPQVVEARGTTAGNTSTASTACYLENVPFEPERAHGKGTQKCFYNGLNTYSDDCTNELIRYCDGGYWRENENAKVCIPAGADRFSRDGSLVYELCPEDIDAEGNKTRGATATLDNGQKLDTASDPAACMLKKSYNVAHGTGTALCSFKADTGVYDLNCGDRVITSCEGGYYRAISSDGKLATDACTEVGNNYYRAAGACTVDGGKDSCTRSACPNGGFTTGTVNTSVTQCYNTNLPYVSDSKHVKEGTQTCFATVAGLYTDRCKDFAITKCVAGYWRTTTTVADSCEAVGQGYYSEGNNTTRNQCPIGKTHVYASDGADPQVVDARGTTAGNTSTASTACYLEKTPYEPTNAHGKGTQTCFYDGLATYGDACTNELIRYCAGGYWRENENAKVCIPAGADHFSREGSLVTEQCPARMDATGTLKHGETANTDSGKEVTAKTPEACMLRVSYDVAHGTGTKLCSFNEQSGTDGQYDLNCGDRVITSCDGGYYRPILSDGKLATDACIEVGKNFYRPQSVCNITSGNDTCMRIACPNNGLTSDTTSASSNMCYLEKVACEVNHGRGENTCNYNPATNKYDAQCTTCDVTGCASGYTEENGNCVQCPAGYVCEDTPDGPVKKTCATMTNNLYPKSDAGAANVSMCYRDCAMGLHATAMTGRDYYGNNQCQISACESGYILSDGKCQVCPAGYYCPTDNPADKVTCPADWTNSDGLATKKEDCYRSCESYPITGGTAVPVSKKAFWPNKCEFKGVSNNGNECDIVNDKCVEISCRNIYEMIDGTCVPCNREHALSYLPNGNCMVASCEIGYHPNGQSCEYDVKTCNAPNAVRASQKWDSKLNSFSTCMIEECEVGYHISSNACVADEQVCAVEHGVGVKEWNSRTNSWGECVATSCDAGYTNDPYETNERSKQCGQCKNKFSTLGEVAASTYIRGCEIASCLYQGELYNLENNECVPICDVNGYEDETGTMKWDPSRKKCVRTCKAGYTMW